VTHKREIFRHGRYEHCAILYWPEMPAGGVPDYIIAMDDKGHEIVCHYAMGIWCEMTAMDLISRLRFHDRNVIETRRNYTQPNTPTAEELVGGNSRP
jgi:hypothetical protein